MALLLIEPDVGQTVLITVAFGAAFWMAGVPMSWIGVLGGLAIVGLGSTYFLFQHVASRVDRFFSHDKTDTHQVDRAAEAIAAGGLFGRGPGEGIMKRHVPDMHTDFAYSAAAEEYGLWLSLVLIALFTLLVVRGLYKAMKLTDPFEQVAAAGPVRAGRHAGLHQRGGEPGPDPDQGHDPAVHLLWRLVHAGHGPDHGHGPGPDPPPARAPTAPARPARPARLPEPAWPRKVAVIAAGGTGGHLFPAQALAEALIARGWRIVLATDDRAHGLSDVSRPRSASPWPPPPSGEAIRWASPAPP